MEWCSIECKVLVEWVTYTIDKDDKKIIRKNIDNINGLELEKAREGKKLCDALWCKILAAEFITVSPLSAKLHYETLD